MTEFEALAKPWVAGLGAYEPGRPIEEVARELGIADVAGIAKLASNENALGPSPRAMAAMRDAVPAMHLYPDGGAYRLKAALAARLDIAPEHLLVGNGSNEMLELLGHVFLGPDTSIVMADCAFVVYRLVAAVERATVIAVPMQAFTHDLPAMAAAIRPDTRLVFIANPNNPTGTLLSGAAIERFMDALPDGVIVCFDEAYIELLDRARQPDTLRYVREGRPVVVLRTFSKTYGLAGLRVGYAVADPDCIRLLNRVRQPFNVNAMALAAAEAALGDEAYVAQTRELVRDGLEFFTAEFVRLGLAYVPSVANFILVRVGRGRAVFEALQRAGIIVRPMDAYGLPDYIRITTGRPEQNRRCIEALVNVLAERR